MRRGHRKILVLFILDIEIFLINVAGATQQADTVRRESTWDLVRKAQTQKTETGEKPAPMRVIHFPKERSIGELMIGNENPGVSPIPVGYPFEQIRWERFGQARGDVKVPMGKLVHLILYSWTWQNPENLSALRQLKPDDIYSLILSPEWSLGGRSPDDNCMPYIVHLTGLKTLNLDGANITTRGLKYLNELKSLERLKPPAGLDDSGMILIGNLKSLKTLYIYKKNNITNEGLKQLSNLKSLELLVLSSVRMTDEGLKVLSDLPLLNNLILDGHFTNDAVLYLKDIPSLKTLKIDMRDFNDHGMRNIFYLTQLENFDAYWIEGITDSGVEYLKDMPNLKKLTIRHSKITDKGLFYLRAIKTLDYLSLPSKGISDVGLTYLGQMSNLKHLDVSRIHYVDPNMDKGYYTDNGVAELAKCKLLEELSIGSLGLTDEGMSHIATLTNLKRLFLFGSSNLTNNGLAKLNTLKSLRNLSIHSANITVGGLSCLNELPNLTDLSLNNLRQDNSGMDISELTKIEDLTITLHRIRKNGAMVYDSFRNEDWACLANLKKLRRLQITGIGIDDDGVKHLSGLSNLEFLNLICPGESRITDQAFKYMSNMDKLNRLYIKDGHFTDKALDYLDDLTLLTRIELTSDYAFSNQAVREFKRKNPDVTRLQLIP